MKVRYFLFIYLILNGFSVNATIKPDAKSIKLVQLSAATTTETSTDLIPVEKGKALVKMFHNDEFVKVQIAVPDESMQMKFIMQGLKVYLDISGKKSKKYCVQFPKIDREQMRGLRQQQRISGQPTANPQERVAMDMIQMTMMLNVNRAEMVNGKIITVLDAENASVKPLEESKLLFTVYLPYSLLGDKIGKNKIISVGLSSEMEAPSGMGPVGGNGRPGGGGMGGPRGGGMRGGGMGGPGGGGMGGTGGGMGGGGGMGPRGGGDMESRGGGEGMRTGGGDGGAFAEMRTPFNTWITFGVE